MSGVAKWDFPYGVITPPWDVVAEIANAIPTEKWVLVGGLMVQAHALMAGCQTRATKDVDLLIDVMADTRNIADVIGGLEALNFLMREPGLRGSPFHRLMRNEQIVDVLIAEHLPSRKRKAAKVKRLPLMETPGGAQAIDRRLTVEFNAGDYSFSINVPDVLGALIMKASAYISDNRDPKRHLEDVALLSSLITDLPFELSRLRGSDKKRLRSVSTAIEKTGQAPWINVPENRRIAGQDALRVLSQ